MTTKQVPDWLHPIVERREGREWRSADLALFFKRKPTLEMQANAALARVQNGHGVPA